MRNILITNYMVDKLAPLDNLLDAEHRLNDPQTSATTERSKIREYIDALEGIGLTGNKGNWRKRFHEMRMVINRLLAGDGDPADVDHFRSRLHLYKAMMARVQTDNYMPTWNDVKVIDDSTGTMSDVSAPYLLFHILDGRPDITAPYVARHKHRATTKRRTAHTTTQTRKKHRTRSGGAPSVSDRQKRSQTYCPYMRTSDGKYTRTQTRHVLCYKGHRYSFRTCCPVCATKIKRSIGTFVLPSTKGAHLLPMRHRDTRQVVQYAKRIGKGCTTKKTRKR